MTSGLVPIVPRGSGQGIATDHGPDSLGTSMFDVVFGLLLFEDLVISIQQLPILPRQGGIKIDLWLRCVGVNSNAKKMSPDLKRVSSHILAFD